MIVVRPCGRSISVARGGGGGGQGEQLPPPPQ